MKQQYNFAGGRRGPVLKTAAGKTRITIRLDDDVLDWFRDKVERAGGGNYQTLMNAALRAHIAREDEPLEDTLRRVLREELGRAPGTTPVRPPTIRRSRTRAKVAAERASSPLDP